MLIAIFVLTSTVTELSMAIQPAAPAAAVPTTGHADRTKHRHVTGQREKAGAGHDRHPDATESQPDPFIADDIRGAVGAYAGAAPQLTASQENPNCYIVELRTSRGPCTYFLAHAASQDDARAQVNAELERNEAGEDIILVVVHPVH